MDINKTLGQFGLDHKEDDVYLALLQLGASGATEIARKAGIKRTTVYDVLTNLRMKGLVSEVIKNKKRIFVAEDPQKLDKLIDEKKDILAEIMPMLKSMHNTKGTKPKVSYYEGDDGLKEVYWKTLEGTKEILGIVPKDAFDYLGEKFAVKYIRKRSDLKIESRVISPETEKMIDFKKKDNKLNRETRLISKKEFPFSTEINIGNNKVAFMSFEEKMGVIVESTAIAENMRLLFELAWKGADSENNEGKKEDESDYWA
jgi:HTH-type transcriptional regulator, sugar sensing transcriptional regulator